MKIITKGTSRIVFVGKRHVVKIPWINFCRLFTVLFKSLNDGTFDERLSYFHRWRILAFLKIPLHLLLANRREYLFFKKNPNEKSLLPITKSYLLGCILVQPRAEVLCPDDPKWAKILLRARKSDSRKFLWFHENFCIFHGRINVLDYADIHTQAFLTSSGFQIVD